MVTRRALRSMRTVDHRRARASLNRAPRVSLKDAATEKVSHGGAQVGDPSVDKNELDEVKLLKISHG